MAVPLLLERWECISAVFSHSAHFFLINRQFILPLPRWHMRSCGWMYSAVYSPSEDPPPAGMIRSVREGSDSHLALSQRYRGGLWMNTSLILIFIFLNQVTFSFFIYLASFFEANGFLIAKERGRRRRRSPVFEGGWRLEWVEWLFVNILGHVLGTMVLDGILLHSLQGVDTIFSRGGGEGNITRRPGMDVNSSTTYWVDKDNGPGLGRRP